MRSIIRFLILSISTLLFTTQAQAAFFQGLGALTSGYSEAGGVSADGSVVAGTSRSASGNYEAFRWTRSRGMEGLGDLIAGEFDSRAYDISSDGLVVVGRGSSETGFEAFRWTRSGGIVGLGNLPGGTFSDAYGVSGDGSIVVGKSQSSSWRTAFRWTYDDGMEVLADSSALIARGVSVDGLVVVGTKSSGSSTEAFRWTESDGLEGLGDLPGGIFHSSGIGVSADGSTIIGISQSANGAEAFRWTRSGGMEGLGDLPGGLFESWPMGVSSDGSVVVGYGRPTSNDAVAFIWDSTNGMRSLKELLTNYGLDLTGWHLSEATDISANGMIIVGTGINPDGKIEAWIADLRETISIDIIPKTCPNECHIKGGGYVDVAIHGTADFNVNDIDIASMRLEGISPVRSSLQDNSAPVISPVDVCDCSIEDRDGFIDLFLKFDKRELLSALGEVNVDQEYPLTLSGKLKDGTPIAGQDCIVFVKKGNKD